VQTVQTAPQSEPINQLVLQNLNCGVNSLVVLNRCAARLWI